MKLSDNKYNETLIFKQPVSPVKEEGQETPTPIHSRGKNDQEKGKAASESTSILCGRFGRKCDFVIKAYYILLGAVTCKH